MKKIVIATMGSRGDVEPYVGLGIELQKLGYEVVISAPIVYRELVDTNHLTFRELKAVNPQEMMKIPEVENQFAKGNMVAAIIVLLKNAKTVIRKYLEEVYNNMQGADLIVLSMVPYGAMDAAEKQKIPIVYTLLNPAVPTRRFPSVVAPGIPKVFNYLSHILLEWGFYIAFKKQLNKLRKEKWGLPKIKRCPIWSERKNGMKTLLAYSNAFIPKPDDWTANEKITGFWKIDNSANYTPDKDLENFLSVQGEKPFYIGFGSMPIDDVTHFIEMVEEALNIINGRALVYLSYNIDKISVHSERIFIVKNIPHSWLFDQVSATIIHGGVGTCRASISAGKPTFVVPFMGDQKFWGLQIYKLGLGPKPVKYNKLSAKLLAEKLIELKLERYLKRAKSIQMQLMQENGAKIAAYEIDKISREKESSN